MRKRVSGQTLLGFVFAVSVFSSCGLETYAIIEPPTSVRYASGTIEANDRYFNFRTTGIIPTGEISFQGTSVFYKIYASASAMNTDITAIANANIQYSANGYNELTTRSYQELNSTERNDPLIPSGGSTVVIRLFDEGSYTARVHGDDTTALDAFKPRTPQTRIPTWGWPLRRSNGKGFNFFATTDTEREDNPMPLSGESDVNYTGFTTGSEWFVNAYAVSVGRDASYTNLHSQLLHLGYIRIRG
jgi:hypothetical protein